MLFPIFTLNLKQKINLKQVCAGKFDGSRTRLAGATSAGKVFVHNPSSVRFDGGNHGDFNFLNINQTVTCLISANFKSSQDFLIIGTSENLLAYDVFNNKDIFNKEVSDKANVAVVGQFGRIERPLAVVGGNCSIQGYDFNGEDCFWTVTGDNVCSLAIMDFDGDGTNELLVGSEDFDIRVFKNDEILTEISENEVVNNLLPLNSSYFAYTLMNGTVGVYDRTSRIWRIKSKNIPNVMTSFDVNDDGIDELITGWSNGKIDVRNVATGDTIFKHTLSHGIAGLIVTDYRDDGHNLLMCCCVDGSIEVFSNNKSDAKLQKKISDHDLFQELSNKKTNLLLELKNYESSNIAASNISSSSSQVAVIPANTQVQSYLYVTNPEESSQKGTVELCVCTSNESLMRAVLIFAEGIFEGESCCVHYPSQLASNKVEIPLYPLKDVPIDLYIKVFVGSKTSNQLHVFEMMRSLPRFSMFLFVTTKNLPEPQGHVQLQLTERMNRVCLWLNQNFLLPEDLTSSDKLDIQFVSLRTSSPIQILMDSSGQLVVKTDDMELAGEMIQQLCSFLNIQHISSVAHFPAEFSKIPDLMTTILEFQSTKLKLSTEMIDNSNVLLNLIVRAEDARIVGDMKSMKRCYMSLLNVNKDLFSYYNMRSNNHKELTELIRQVHVIIQRAAKLRYGKFKTDVTNGCKKAIKNNNSDMFLKIVKVGCT